MMRLRMKIKDVLASKGQEVLTIKRSKTTPIPNLMKREYDNRYLKQHMLGNESYISIEPATQILILRK